MLSTPPFDARDSAQLADLGTALTDWLAGTGRDARLARLLSGEPVDAKAVDYVFAPHDLGARLRDHGLLAIDGSEVRLPFQIRLVDDGVVVTDHPNRKWRDEPGYLDPLWAGPTLNKLLVRGRTNRALDVGCGSGVMTIAAARFCDRVVGVDVNPRAIAFSRLNVALNGLTNVELIESDLFEAVKGQRFDRIVFNSPTGFELRPRNWLEAGEAILERFFANLLEHLDARGCAQIALCFMNRRRSTFWNRLGPWLNSGHQPLQVVLLEQFHLEGGWPFLTLRALQTLKDRANGFDVTAVTRGWLVVRRGASVSLRVPLDYKREASRLTPDFGSVLIELLLSSQGRLEVGDLERAGIAPLDVAADSVRRADVIPWQ